MLTAHGITLDADRHEVKVGGQLIALTALEFKLLKLFLERPGRVQTRDTLLSDVWGIEADVTTRTVDTHIKRLREKLGPAGDGDRDDSRRRLQAGGLMRRLTLLATVTMGAVLLAVGVSPLWVAAALLAAFGLLALSPLAASAPALPAAPPKNDETATSDRELKVLRAVVDGMSEGVWITDGEGTVVQHNSALKQMLFSGTELTGKKPDRAAPQQRRAGRGRGQGLQRGR